MTRKEYQQVQWNKAHKINDDGIIERQCSKCGEWKVENTDNFYMMNKSKPEKGFQSECKKCISERSLKFQQKHQERHAERNRIARKENRWNYKEIMRKSSERRRYNGKRKEWEEKNKDKVNGYVRYKQQHGTHKVSSKEWESCKKYFAYRCAYCGLPIEEHYITYKGEVKWSDLHKEHVNHEGANDLSNCVPSCRQCNSEKYIFNFNDWYNELNINFSQERYNRIMKWLNEDYKKYIIIKTNNVAWKSN